MIVDEGLLPKIDFEMYDRKFSKTNEKNTIKYNQMAVKDWTSLKKSTQLKKIIGNQKKQKLVIKNK